MHRLVLMRHAKAVPMGILEDHERPLAARGIRDCEAAADWLNAQPWQIDHAVVSTAMRTRQTFSEVAKHLRRPLAAELDEKIYEASPGDILSVVHRCSGQTVLVVGHSPGIPRLAIALADEVRPDAFGASGGYPTATMTVLECDLPWSLWQPACAKLVQVHIPRGDASSPDID